MKTLYRDSISSHVYSTTDARTHTHSRRPSFLDRRDNASRRFSVLSYRPDRWPSFVSDLRRFTLAHTSARRITTPDLQRPSLTPSELKQISHELNDLRQRPSLLDDNDPCRPLTPNDPRRPLTPDDPRRPLTPDVPSLIPAETKRHSLTPPIRHRPSAESKRPSLTLTDASTKRPLRSQRASLTLDPFLRFPPLPPLQGGGEGAGPGSEVAGLTKEQEHDLRMNIVQLESELDEVQTQMAEKDDIISTLSMLTPPPPSIYGRCA